MNFTANSRKWLIAWRELRDETPPYTVHSTKIRLLHPHYVPVRCLQNQGKSIAY